MDERKVLLKDLKDGNVKITLMIMKKLYKEKNKIVYTLCDKSSYINARISDRLKLEVGQVIEV